MATNLQKKEEERPKFALSLRQGRRRTGGRTSLAAVRTRLTPSEDPKTCSVGGGGRRSRRFLSASLGGGGGGGDTDFVTSVTVAVVLFLGADKKVFLTEQLGPPPQMLALATSGPRSPSLLSGRSQLSRLGVGDLSVSAVLARRHLLAH